MSKNIIICSDGTGQKGGYGADSNVYKLYQMVDLNSKLKQISIYDNGIGTSDSDTDSKTNAIWRAITSAFGFGFKKNILDLYLFIARNYALGDKIYFFGFSRGAATVRACVGLIHHCGLLNINHADLNTDEKIESCLQDAIKSYQEWKDGKKATIFKEKWAIRDPICAPDGDLKIHFVGVWDTVSALGFPKDVPIFSKLFEKLDECYSGTYDFELNKNVQYAYQALSIDDARETFRPMIWDENKGNIVEQVWFAGVHSNVGGGYPRSELSDISFDWMLERAQHHGLMFVNDERDSVRDHANQHGKLYDSRDGFGLYYRYKPRNLTELCDKKAPARIHETVFERMKCQTAKYAPSYIPNSFDVVKTELEQDRKSITVAVDNTTVDKWAKYRRRLYDFFLGMSSLLLFAATWLWKNPTQSVLDVLKKICELCGTKEDNGLDIALWIYDILHYLMPALFENFLIFAVRVHFSLFLGCVGIVYVMYKARRYILIKLQKELEKIRSLILSNVEL